jgi:hypothetical protein
MMIGTSVWVLAVYVFLLFVLIYGVVKGVYRISTEGQQEEGYLPEPRVGPDYPVKGNSR